MGFNSSVIGHEDVREDGDVARSVGHFHVVVQAARVPEVGPLLSGTTTALLLLGVDGGASLRPGANGWEDDET